MDREAETETSFTQVVEIARMIMWIHGCGRESTSDKRPCHFGGFSGASSGGRGFLAEVILFDHYSQYSRFLMVHQVAMVLLFLGRGNHHIMHF